MTAHSSNASTTGCKVAQHAPGRTACSLPPTASYGGVLSAEGHTNRSGFLSNISRTDSVVCEEQALVPTRTDTCGVTTGPVSCQKNKKIHVPFHGLGFESAV